MCMQMMVNLKSDVKIVIIQSPFWLRCAMWHIKIRAINDCNFLLLISYSSLSFSPCSHRHMRVVCVCVRARSGKLMYRHNEDVNAVNDNLMVRIWFEGWTRTINQFLQTVHSFQTFSMRTFTPHTAYICIWSTKMHSYERNKQKNWPPHFHLSFSQI